MELQYVQTNKTVKAKSKSQSKKATGDPESAVVDGTLIYCSGETLRTNYAGIY